MNTSNDLPFAELVYDGGTEAWAKISVPRALGVPRPDQLIGSAREQVAELCGRCCYDSLGSGRSSAAYHAHIREVGHGSVYEHTPISVLLILSYPTAAMICANRPGVYVRPGEYAKSHFQNGEGSIVTINPRAVLEWNYFTASLPQTLQEQANAVGEALYNAMGHVMPNIFLRKMKLLCAGDILYSLAEPATDDERWVSLWMRGSRGFSHEQVRHGDWSAISQRSTRYVDESSGQWVVHPLLREYLAATNDVELKADMLLLVADAAKLYDRIVEKLQAYGERMNFDKVTARKQARGAARGYLGNALETQMIFSASVAQWRRQIVQRANPAADGEIREIYGDVLRELRRSRYADRFTDELIDGERKACEGRLL